MAKKIGAGGEPQGYDTKNGRYEKDGGATAETKSEHEKAIDIYSDTPEEDKKNAPLKSVQKPEIAYGFANKERKNTRHHKDHAKEMGYKNQDEYERAAVEFFNSDKGKLYYGNARDRYYRYNENTGEYAVSSNGVIHTYMKKTKKEFERAKIQEKLNEQ